MLKNKIQNKVILNKTQINKGVLRVQQDGRKKIIAGATATVILTSSFAGVQAMGNDDATKKITMTNSTEVIASFEPNIELNSYAKLQEVLELNHKKPEPESDDKVQVENNQVEEDNTAIVDQKATAKTAPTITMNTKAKSALSEKDIEIAKNSPALDGINLVHPTEAKKLVQTTPIAITGNNVSIENFSDENMYAAGASSLVRSAEDEVKSAINNKYKGLTGYTELALAIAQKESGGNIEDVFQSSQAAGKPMNTLSRKESVDWGLKKLEKAVEYFKKHPEYDARYLFYAYNGGDAVYKELEEVNGVFKIQYVQEMYDKFYKKGKARGETFYQDVTPVAWLQVKYGDYTYAPVLMEFCAFDEEISTESIATGSYIKDAVVEGKEVKVNVNGEQINIAEVNLAGVNKESANAILNQLKESGGYVNTKNAMLIALLSKLENEQMNKYLAAEIKGKYLDRLVEFKDAIINPDENSVDKAQLDNLLDVENFSLTAGGKTYKTTAVGQSQNVDSATGKSNYSVRLATIEQAKEQYDILKSVPEKYGKVSIQLNEKLEAKEGKRVILDIGHALKAGKQSGADPGARNILTGGKSEATLNTELAKIVKEKAESKGFEVVLINPITGEHDYKKGSRGTKASQLDGDILLSIHHNSLGKAQRSEVIFSKNYASAESKRIADKFQQVHVQAIPDLEDGGSKGGIISMLDYFEKADNDNTPAIIVEPIPISNVLGSVIADQEAVVESLANGYVNTLLEEFGQAVDKVTIIEESAEVEVKETVPVVEKQTEAEPEPEKEITVNEEQAVTESKEEVPVIEEQTKIETTDVTSNEETNEETIEETIEETNVEDTIVEEAENVESTEAKVEEGAEGFSGEEKENLFNFFSKLLK